MICVSVIDLDMLSGRLSTSITLCELFSGSSRLPYYLNRETNMINFCWMPSHIGITDNDNKA